jgi:hypothetical protein
VICAVAALLALLCWCCMRKPARIFDSALLAILRV